MKYPTITYHRRYQIIAFVTGFVLLAYELVGSRIITPMIGSSTYVWTSIIGVIIAALSLGYYLGGRWADARHNKADIAALLIAATGGIVSTLILSDPVLAAVSELPIDVRFQAIIVSLVLFAPTSVILGAISPYLARLHTESLQQTGRSIATLSALNSLGGITGTFLVGFVFFGFMGTRQTLLILIALLLACVLLMATRKNVSDYLKVFVAIIFISAIAATVRFSGTVVASIETPSSSYQVQDVMYGNEPVRVLTMGPRGYQSGIYKDGSKELVFGYTQAIAKGVSLHGNPKNILILGGGTFTMPTYFSAAYPDTQIDVVEIDPELQAVATEYFRYKSPKNIKIYSEDGRTFLNNNGKKYDVIIIDAFSDTGTPFSLTTEEAAERLSRSLSPNGVVLSNIIAGSNPGCRSLLSSIFTTYSQSMEGSLRAVRDTSLAERQNIIAAFTNDNRRFIEQYSNASINTQNSPVLSDNYAPIERFQQSCLNANL